MNKKLNCFLILLFFSLLNCDYKPVLSKKNYNFTISTNKINGDQKINSIIINNFNKLKSKDKKYFVNLSSKKQKNIISKDSKGDPSIFELIVNVDYSVDKDGKTIFYKPFIKKRKKYNIKRLKR